MEKTELQEGDILQINPEHEKFGGFYLVVTEPKSWGAQGYLLSTGGFEAVRYKERAYLRLKFEDIELCGKSYWITKEKEDEDL